MKFFDHFSGKRVDFNFKFGRADRIIGTPKEEPAAPVLKDDWRFYTDADTNHQRFPKLYGATPKNVSDPQFKNGHPDAAGWFHKDHKPAVSGWYETDANYGGDGQKFQFWNGADHHWCGVRCTPYTPIAGHDLEFKSAYQFVKWRHIK